MKNKFYYLAVVMLVTMIFNSKNAWSQLLCEASFSVTVNNSTKTAAFTNTSRHNNTSTGGDYYYYWSFGDGTTSDNANPTKTYANAGAYRVCLHIIKKDSSCTSTFCDSILVGTTPPPSPCNAAWSMNKDMSNPLKANFSALLNDTGFMYLWTFGDGTQSDNRTPSHTYAHTGAYKVCLRVKKKDLSCVAEHCDSILLSPLCNPYFAKIKSNSLPKTWLFEANTNDTNYTYNYTFGDGTAATGRFQTHTYASNGTYTVCLHVTRKDSSCTEQYCLTVTVGEISTQPCQANFNFFVSDSLGADPNTVRFTNTSTGTYTRCVYTFGDGTMSDNCNPIHHYSGSGTKTACLTIYKITPGNDTLCRSTTCKTFTLGHSTPPPGCAAVFSFSRIGLSSTYKFINYSVGANLIYTWVMDGDTLYHSRNAEHNFLTPGLHTACLYITSSTDSSCNSSFCVNVLFPGVIAGNQYCAPSYNAQQNSSSGSYRFSSAQGVAVYNLWNFGDGSIAYGSAIDHQYGADGEYTVCLQVTNTTDSCSDMLCSPMIVSGTTGMQHIQLNNLSIYPVPAEDVLNIALDVKSESSGIIEIIDLQGKQIMVRTENFSKGWNTREVNTAAWPQGIYLLRIQAEGQTLTRKFTR